MVFHTIPTFRYYFRNPYLHFHKKVTIISVLVTSNKPSPLKLRGLSYALLELNTNCKPFPSK